ncbi:MAG: site-specific integrase [Verrucomicrobiota bacterium]
MACIWKLPNGKSPYWIAQFRSADGRRVNKSTKQSERKKAQAVADEWEAASKKARSHELTQTASIQILSKLMEITTGDALQTASIEEHLKQWLVSRSTLGRADATGKRYKAVTDSFLAFLGPERCKGGIRSLSASEIERWRDTELASGKGASTCDFGIKVLRAALEAAKRKGMTESNVADAVEKSGGAQEEREPFADDEIRLLMAAASDEWRGMILFGVHLGLRLMDAASITWGQIDLAGKTLSIVASKTKAHAPKPKILALHAELVEYLETLPRGIGAAPLFPSLHGRKAGSHGGLSNEFSRLMKKAKIAVPMGAEKTGKGRRTRTKGFHALRHSSISRMANAGTSADVRKEIAGHSSDAVHRRYTHLSLDAQRGAVEKMPSIGGAEK